MIQFPSNFLWGAATSAYQVEGGNTNADWWQWEKASGKEPSGSACRHYQLYAQDFDLAKSLNHTAHRFSIEWSRVEPEEGKFSNEAVEHYLNVILALKARGIEPIVTLHHFTNPCWAADKGGWLNRKTVGLFLRYCSFITEALAKHAHYWITINEPTIFLSHAYLFGVWPPQKKSLLEAAKTRDNLVEAHVKAYRLIHAVYQKALLPAPEVSFSQYTQSFIPCTRSAKNRFAAFLRDRLFNFGFIDAAAQKKTLDFIGMNYYSRQLVDVKSWWIRNLLADTCSKDHHRVAKNSLGWDIYPEGLYDILLKLKPYKLPVIITENGISTDDDQQRWEYISAHLNQVHRAMEQGVAVKGYLYWSLIDNFEWDKGFSPRFGLIDVDYRNYKRTVRESARKFATVCKTGSVAL